jgi:hypothetical protein
LFAGEVFFRDQIHPVPQGGNQSDMGNPIQGDQGRKGQESILIHHRCPMGIAQIPVDFPNRFVDFLFHPLVLLDFFA